MASTSKNVGSRKDGGHRKSLPARLFIQMLPKNGLEWPATPNALRYHRRDRNVRSALKHYCASMTTPYVESELADMLEVAIVAMKLWGPKWLEDPKYGWKALIEWIRPRVDWAQLLSRGELRDLIRAIVQARRRWVANRGSNGDVCRLARVTDQYMLYGSRVVFFTFEDYNDETGRLT